MDATTEDSAALPLDDAVGRWLGRVARLAALFGGILLSALMLIVIVSIVGRQLVAWGFGPVPGDFELVEMGTAIAVAAFLPLCQMREGHVIVDLFFRSSGTRRMAVFGLVAHATFALVVGLLTWQQVAGLQERLTYAETTMVLQLPVWWGFAGLIPFLALSALCAVYMTWRYAARVAGAEP